MTIQQQRRPTTSTRGSEKSTLKKSLLACFIVLSTLAATATAEIIFTSPPANSTFRPRDSLLLTWAIRPVNASVPTNTDPFDISLRAFTGQRYSIQTGVAQGTLSLQVQIPVDVTGGLHSFYAEYKNVVAPQKNVESSRQFNIPLPIVTTTPPATRTNTGGAGVPTDPANNPPTESSGGLSAGALGGIIGGVIAILMAVAMCFLCRHRRRVAEDRKDSTSRSMEGKSGLAKEGGGTHQDKESLTKSAGSAGGIPDMRSEGQEAVPLKLNRPVDGSPRSQHQNQHQQQYQNQHQQNHNQQRPISPTATRNPFEAPEMMIHPNSPNGAPSPRQHNNQNHQYQPPQLPPPHQSPFGTPPQQYSGMPPNPLMGGQQPGGPGQRNQSPYHQSNRDSFESELESAYDPHPRMVNPPINRNNGPSPMNNGSASPLGYSSSTGSSRYPRNMSPQPNPGSPLNQQAQQDREILAVAAAVAAAASPVPAHRQVQNQQNQQQQKPGASPRMKEIEMQQFDVHQHHQEQQQKMLQRQQQQQQQQRSAQSTPTPLPAAQKSMNPTQFDDKAEFSDSEDDEQHQNPFQKPQNQQYPQPDVKPPPPVPASAPVVAAPFTPAPAAAALAHPPPPPPPAAPVVEDGPVYNGYRDTIFGAYATNQDDDDEDEDNSMPNPVPALPPVSAVISSPPITATASTTYQPPPGGAEIVRKKSVKFTGVPKSGPIVLPNHEAAKEHQQQRQQIKQQQNQTQQGQYNQEEEDSDEFYSQDDEEIRARMLETAESITSPSVSTSSASFNKPTVNTTNGTANGNGNNNALSPIRSPDQLHQQHQQYSNNPYQLGEDEDSTDDEAYMDDDPYGAYTTPMPPPQAPYAHQGNPGGVEDSPRLNAVVSPASDDDFFGDVLAAVEKTAVPAPPTSSSSTTSQSQFNPDNFVKPKMPAMPSQEPAQVAQYGTVQQQHIPPAQPQHLTQEVFGAPSPRMKPAALPTTAQQYQQQHGYPAPPPPAPPARAKGHSPVMQKAVNNSNNNGNDPYF
ncbi:MAG: hypothetical protein JOS17DRAFT_461910 [Linnemannia elongata]|nr:MAG: hypothetical protein JOS17DRAFT_461910 [Linnemannia elongata]